MRDNIPNVTIKQVEEVIRFISPSMDDYLYILDFQKDYYMISPGAAERFLLPGCEFYNATKAFETFVFEDDMSILAEEIQALSSGAKVTHNLHYRWLGKDKRPLWINCRGHVLKNAANEPQFVIGCINEIGIRQKADNVSGLLGETSLSAYFRDHVSEVRQGFALRIGIDDFKDINENFGIEYGDYILRKTAECIAENIKPGQQIYRIVADEFMVLDYEESTMDGVRNLHKRICASIEKFEENNHYETVYTVSGGILDLQFPDNSYSNVMKLTEFSLNEAKRQGKNQYYVFNQDDYDAYIRKKDLIRVMRQAVYHDFVGFEVYFQPIVKTDGYGLVGAEALLRFQGAAQNPVSPGEFIPILEETGLIIPVGRYVLQKALGVCKEWQKVIPGFQMNINLSYIQVMKSQVFREIIAEIEEYGLKPWDVNIELTESGYLETNTHFTKLWKKLKDYGVQLALDDFGTGYSNLHCLYDLNPSIVKIDHSFTKKALSNEYQYKLMVYIIEMSHSLGLKVCIEGIETEEGLRSIGKLSPDYIQGFLFGKPCSQKTFYSAFLSGEGDRVLELPRRKQNHQI